MYVFLKGLWRSIHLYLSLILVIILMASSPAYTINKDSPDVMNLPASIGASDNTNVDSLRSTPPVKSEEEFKEAPHIYDMESIRKFDRNLYHPTTEKPRETSQKSSS